MDLPPRTSQPSLEGVPAEIVITIYNQLPAEAKITFALTCRRFRHEFSTDYQHLLLQLPGTHHRLLLAQLLERDGLLIGRCCDSCFTVHPETDFPPDELTESPKERPARCWKTYRGLWLTPLGNLSFNAVQNKLRNRTNTEDPEFWRELPGLSWWSSDKKSHSYKILTSYTIVPPSNDPLPPKAWFEEFAKSFNIPLCPHLRLGDDLVVNQYDPKIFWHWKNGFYCFCPCKGTQDSRCPKCEYCHTTVHLRFKADGTDGPLSLTVSRDIGTLSSHRDPKWRSQCISHADPALEAYWWSAFGWKAHEMPLERPDTGGDDNASTFPKFVASRSKKEFAEKRDFHDRETFFLPITGGPDAASGTEPPQNTAAQTVRNLWIWKSYFERGCRRMLSGG